jgi:hypothetical protein
MIRSFSVFSISALLLLAACGGEGQDFGTSESEISDNDALVAAPENLVGTWLSSSCGKRTYGRKIQFDLGGTFTGMDLVSPCPPDVVCFWSGIVHRKGTYTVVENTIKLAVSEPRTMSAGQPFPTELVIDRATNAPAETTPDGDYCVYVRDNPNTATPSPRR